MMIKPVIRSDLARHRGGEQPESEDCVANHQYNCGNLAQHGGASVFRLTQGKGVRDHDRTDVSQHDSGDLQVPEDSHRTMVGEEAILACPPEIVCGIQWFFRINPARERR